MSGVGTGLAPIALVEILPKGRTPLAHLLHALNQPLTGLQCSLELAAAGPRRPDQYLRTLQEGLELTARMRVLVEALRELADIEAGAPAPGTGAASATRPETPFAMLLQETVAELEPVADTRRVSLALQIQAAPPAGLAFERSRMATLLFRLLESAVSLAREGSALEVALRPEASGGVQLFLAWSPGPPPPYSPFSRSELGLLIARAGWEQAGVRWHSALDGQRQTCSLQIASVASPHAGKQAGRGKEKNAGEKSSAEETRAGEEKR